MFNRFTWLDAVCSVYGGNKNIYSSAGVGAFISADIVLTTWHGVKGHKEVVVTTNSRRRAYFREDQPREVSTDLDAALIKLDQPVGRSFLSLPGPGISRFDQAFWMASRYAATPSVTPVFFQEKAFRKKVSLRESYLIPQIIDESDIAAFHSGIPILAGYSGSVVTTHDGTLLTIVTKAPAHPRACLTARQHKNQKWDNFVKYIGPGSFSWLPELTRHFKRVSLPEHPPIKGPYDFYGPDPIKLARFVQDACKKLG